MQRLFNYVRPAMGNSSSQIAPSQAITQDIPQTSQPTSQIPGLDGTQDDDESQALNRVASTMDAWVEDTNKKGKRARTKNPSRTQRKSMPQHMRGHAIQPSQEIPDTQEEAQTTAGAGERDTQKDAETRGQDDGEEIAVTQPDGLEPPPVVKKAKKTPCKKKRWDSHEINAETGREEAKVEARALDHVDVNTLDNDELPLTKQRKRKRKDVELERLQRDAEDFAPDFESTPKPKPMHEGRKQRKDVDQPETIQEQPESDVEGRDGVAELRPQKPSKKTAALKLNSSESERPGVSASQSKTLRTRKPRVAAESGPMATAAESQSKSASGHKKNARPGDQAGQIVDQVGYDDAGQGAEQVASADDDGDDPPADSIPTPPVSHEEPESDAEKVGEEAVGNGDKRKTNSAAGAKASKTVKKRTSAAKDRKRKRGDGGQKSDAGRRRKDDEAEDSAEENVDENQDPTQKNAKSPLKERNEDENEGDEYHNEGDNESGDSEDTNKKVAAKAKETSKASKTASIEDSASKAERGQVKGTWSKEDVALADEIFYGVVRVTAVPDYELKINIIDWKNPSPALRQLKDELYEAFPKRDFKSIARFCQRRYNSYDRGKWTAEQDQLLREAYELNPDQWTTISDAVGRFWEDCRMRWRDQLCRGAKAETGPWSRDEEAKLASIVQECRQLVNEEAQDDEVRDDPEKADAMISWKVVAEKMGNTRAAKRCREKWARIKRHGISADRDAEAAQEPKTKSDKPSYRMREVEGDYLLCETGDIYDIICEICSAIPDPDKVFDHETTFWSVVAIRNPESRFTSSLRRRAFQAAVEDYSCKALSRADTLAAEAEAVKNRMEALERKGRIEFGRSFVGTLKKRKAVKGADDFEAEEDDEEPAKKKAKKSKSKKSTKKQHEAAEEEQALEEPEKRPAKTKFRANPSKKPAAPKTHNAFKSADLVVESEDEDDTVTTGDDVQVAQTQMPARDVADHDAEARERRQQTEERSLSDAPADMSPSTFVELCKGGVKRVRSSGKSVEGNEGRARGKSKKVGGGKRRREGMKG